MEDDHCKGFGGDFCLVGDGEGTFLCNSFPKMFPSPVPLPWQNVGREAKRMPVTSVHVFFVL